VQNVTPAAIATLVMELAPVVAFGFAAERVTRAVQRWPVAARMAFAALYVLPYVLVSASQHIFQWKWFALYAGLPVVIAWLLGQAGWHGAVRPAHPFMTGKRRKAKKDLQSLGKLFGGSE